MSNNESIPIIFGVTGHRDLREQDIAKLERIIQNLFNEYKKKYPHTHLMVITGMAEGADMLVAEVAQDMGIEVRAILPYEKDKYLGSFDRPENIEKFNSLVKKMSGLPHVLNSIDEKSDEDCYEELGYHIADHCNILLAFWDGVDLGLRGGTAAIVKYMEAGVKDNKFDLVDGNALFWIKTPRVKNEEIKDPLSIERKYLGWDEKSGKHEEQFVQMLREINKENKFFKKHKKIAAKNTLISNAYGFFDETAKNKKEKFVFRYILVLFLSFFAFLSLEVMHVFHIDLLVFSYIVLLISAFFVYFVLMLGGKLQDKFVYRRGMAEALRTQNVWNTVGVSDTVARYFLVRQHHPKFLWVKTAVKNIAFVDNTPFVPSGESDGLRSGESWVSSQINYSKSTRTDRGMELKKLEKIEKGAFRFGTFSFVLMSLVLVLKYMNYLPTNIWLFVLPENFWKYVWKVFMLFSSIGFLVFVFIGEKYLKVLGYKEELAELGVKLSQFYAAKNEIDEIKKKKLNSEEEKKEVSEVMHDLGIQSLIENSRWVMLHISRRGKAGVE